MKTIFRLAAMIALGAVFSGCFYDKESELYPQGSCDTGAVRYSTAIRSIMETQCATVSCHAGTNPARGILLSSYDGVRAIALDGSLTGVVEHAAGYSPMPPTSTKLPDCQISRIRIWVAAGAQNN